MLQIRRPDESAPRPYDNEPVPALDEAPKDSRVQWAAYEGDFPWVPQTFGLQTVGQGVSKTVDANVSASASVVEYRGIIDAPETATYTFTVDSDGGAILRLHEAVVVDNESVLDGERATLGSILLEKGAHPFILTCRIAKPGKPSLVFAYSR